MTVNGSTHGISISPRPCCVASFFGAAGMTTELTQARVRELFAYDPETGFLSRLTTVQGGAQAGAIVGWDNGQGYLQAWIDRKTYLVHRVIWLWVYGGFPKDQIDHKNHDRADNRISNLRDATRNENQKNKSIPSNNTSGVMGVCWDKRYRKWRAHIQATDKKIHLGYFEYKAEAVDARKVAEKKHGFYEKHGT